jgi:hypothetical protein
MSCGFVCCVVVFACAFPTISHQFFHAFPSTTQVLLLQSPTSSPSTQSSLSTAPLVPAPPLVGDANSFVGLLLTFVHFQRFLTKSSLHIILQHSCCHFQLSTYSLQSPHSTFMSTSSGLTDYPYRLERRFDCCITVWFPFLFNPILIKFCFSILCFSFYSCWCLLLLSR